MLYYKNQNYIGIRRKKPQGDEVNGKQIFGFGAGTGLSEQVLRTWAGKVLKKMDEGMSEDETHRWITGKMNK